VLPLGLGLRLEQVGALRGELRLRLGEAGRVSHFGAKDLNAAGLDELMHDPSPEELDVLQQLLRRLTEDFVQRGRDRKSADSAL
jgi:hypothetical protein